MNARIQGLVISNDRELIAGLVEWQSPEASRGYDMSVVDTVEQARNALQRWPSRIVIDFDIEERVALHLLQAAADIREVAWGQGKRIQLFVLFREENAVPVSRNTTVLRKPIPPLELLRRVFGYR